MTDFRGFAEGPRGYKVGIRSKTEGVGSKRKLDEYEEQARGALWVAHSIH
jgi:hypothetical protein